MIFVPGFPYEPLPPGNPLPDYYLGGRAPQAGTCCPSDLAPQEESGLRDWSRITGPHDTTLAPDSTTATMIRPAIRKPVWPWCRPTYRKAGRNAQSPKQEQAAGGWVVDQGSSIPGSR